MMGDRATNHRSSADDVGGRYSIREERRSRKQLSCAECHRLKLKCDRIVPCSNCVRRECVDLCPNSIRVKKKNDSEGPVVTELRERLAAIEGLLSEAIPRAERPRQRSREMSDNRFGDHRYERTHHRSRSRSYSPQRSHGTHGSSRNTNHISQMYSAPQAHLDMPSSSSLPYPNRTGPLPRSDPFTFQYDHGSRMESTVNVPSQSDPSQDESYGTLVIDRSGRSKWLGPTAGTEWLKNQEISGENTPRRSRSPSDRLPSPEPQANFGFGQESLFPFAPWGPAPSMDTITAHLPAGDEATVLIDSYYRNYTWNHDVAPRRTLQPIFDRAYGLTNGGNSRDPTIRRVHPQQLALLFIILAMGALHNPDLPPNDPSAEHFVACARWSLVKGDFIGHNTIAGLQAVVIMAHYHLETEKGRNGDSTWPLWGLAMRLVTAMGLHRDGERWNLPSEVVDERRQVFWECHTIDVFQANCFSRPSALRPEHIDTEFPSQTWADGPNGSKSFRTLKFELCRISGAVLDQAMDVRPTSYSAITALYDRLCAFERLIPFHLRCRTALLALPSVYADAESATRDSPEVNQRNLHRTFQQFTLALNVSESILFLQRPYFVKALQDHPQDPTRSAYGKSYLAVVERCNVIIEVVGGLYELYPTVTARHWFFWYHLFTAAVCIGTMTIKNSNNPLAGFALGQIDHSIKLYSSVLRDHATPSLVQNHQWLLRLRQRAMRKMDRVPLADQILPNDEESNEADVELLGWRTRLIQRAAKGNHFRTNIIPASGNTLSSYSISPLTQMSPPVVAPAPTLDQVLQQHFVPNDQPMLPTLPSGAANGVDLTTDLFLHQFWDPTTLLESRSGSDVPTLTTANWWNWDVELNALAPPPVDNQFSNGGR